MNKFTISDLERFSGIKAHTIRIWEQRYNTLQPNRSEGNTRYYTSQQLRRLLNIVSLLEDKRRISDLSELQDEQLFSLIEEKLNAAIQDPYDSFVLQFVSAAIDFDEPYFDKLFANCVLRFGLKNTYKNILYPLLKRLGMMWAGNLLPPSKEHFVSNLIRQKIFSAIDAVPPVNQSKEKWMLFLPEDEYHELGLLFANFLIRQSGRQVIYLGPNVPFETLSDVVKETSPDHMYFFLVRRDSPEDLRKFLDELEKNFKDVQLNVSGDASYLEKHLQGRTIQIIKSMDELEKML